MKKINLTDGTKIHCLKETEALVLDEHINGYLEIGLEISKKGAIIDVGANIGVFGMRLSQKFKKAGNVISSLFLFNIIFNL